MDRGPVALNHEDGSAVPIHDRRVLERCLGSMTIPTIEEVEFGNETSCLICHETFVAGDTPELPIKLHCNHIIGSQCLMQWLLSRPSSMNTRRRNSCPMCRARILREPRRENIQQTPTPVDPPRQPEPENKLYIAINLVVDLILSLILSLILMVVLFLSIVCVSFTLTAILKTITTPSSTSL